MSLTCGTRLGPYEIVAPIGAGGMGEVYRARDTKLDRDVAIKVLPESFALDADRVARFTREAKTLAALNHPNIAAIYGIEEQGHTRALVMELVSGRGLDELTGLSLERVLAISRQLIEGLDAAHEAGVVHRDLKPANIRVRDDGMVKILDFGLAKIWSPETGSAPGEGSSTLTLTSPMMTQQGIILGTAAYMSPEQAKAQTVDRRADIWAFGAVLYEMLTARRAFPGDTLSETIANVLKESPDWRALPPATPSGVRRLVTRCLEKDVRKRLQAIGDARIDLDDRAPDSIGAASISRSAMPRIAVTGALILALAGWGLWFRASTSQAGPVGIVRLSITPPGRYAMYRRFNSSDANAHWAFTADGTQLAFIAEKDGTRVLMVRALDRFDARPLPGTEGADFPFWSPDGTAIGFFADGKMKRVSAAGDGLRTICDCATNSAATWGNGVILYATGSNGDRASQDLSLRTVPESGGPETPLALENASLTTAAWPAFLPDGRHFIFLDRTSAPADRRIMLASLDGKMAKALVKSSFKARYAASGHLLYMRDGVLVAQRLDIERAELSGPVLPIADDVLLSEVPGQATYEASFSGAVAYQTRGQAVPSSLSWFGRDGRPGESVLAPDMFITFDLSRDGRRLALSSGDNSVENEEPPSLVSLFEFERKLRTRVRLADARSAETPLFSPDGGRMVFAAHAKAGMLAEVRMQAVTGTGAAEVVAKGANYHPIDWSPDGRYLLLHDIGSALAHIGMASVDLQGDRTPVPFAASSASVAQGQFSPDGRFVAYSSDTTGRGEIYLQHFPASGPPLSVSAGGGTQPRWRRDGRELYFVSADGALMAVSVSLGATPSVGAPVRLFDSGIASDNYFYYGGAPMYAPSKDGQQFLVIRSLTSGDPGSIRVVLNAVRKWMPMRRETS